MLNELHQYTPRASTLDLKQIVSFGCAIVSPESTLPDFPVDSLKNIAKVIENNPSIPVHNAIYRLYPYKLFLPKDSVQGVLTLLNSLNITIPPEESHHKHRIVGTKSTAQVDTSGNTMNKNLTAIKCVGKFYFRFLF